MTESMWRAQYHEQPGKDWLKLYLLLAIALETLFTFWSRQLFSRTVFPQFNIYFTLYWLFYSVLATGSDSKWYE